MKTMKTCKMGCGKMKAGGAVKKIKKMQPGGQANAALLSAINRKGVPMSGPTGTNNSQSNIIMKNGGTMKNAKLAAMAAPKNKITRADIITAVTKKKKSKKK